MANPGVRMLPATRCTYLSGAQVGEIRVESRPQTAAMRDLGKNVYRQTAQWL